MRTIIAALSFFFLTWLFIIPTVGARDLQDIQEEGTLRHLGVPYANFVTGDGWGLSVEMMKLFATEIGVRYQYVETDWKIMLSVI